MRILITDGLQRKTLAAVRTLGKSGDEIFLAEYTRINPCAFSNCVKKSLLSPNPTHAPEAYLKWLLLTLEKYEIDLLLPMDDASMKIVVMHQEVIGRLTHVLVPEPSAYLKATDKGRSVIAASLANAVCPVTYTPENLDELIEIVKVLKFPVLTKPKVSSGSRGIRIVNDHDALMAYCGKYARKTGGFPIIQTYIKQGTKYDVCMLYDANGQLVSSFVQEEMRQYPEPMGPSTMQRSIYDEALTDIADKIMRSIGWRGIAEVEFMKSPIDEQYYFMEINTRFWASLQCAISSGIDFPQLYKACAFQTPIEHINYRENVIVRWLFPGDILRFVTYGKKVRWQPPFIIKRSVGVIDDVYDAKDKAPVIGVMLTMLRFAFDLSMWKSFFWR